MDMKGKYTMELKKSSGAGAGSLLAVFTEAVSTAGGGVAVRFGVTLDPCFFVDGFSLLAADARKTGCLDHDTSLERGNDFGRICHVVTRLQVMKGNAQLHVFLKARLKLEIIDSWNGERLPVKIPEKKSPLVRPPTSPCSSSFR